jgi:RHS repeat-associated protein
MTFGRDGEGGMPPKHLRLPTTPQTTPEEGDRRSTEPSSPATTKREPALAPTPVEAPTPSLPKGGGAIRSIGERPSVNPATGAGSMSLSLAAPPGRAGFGPQLGLAYSSGIGNGPFGLGWSLTVPSITRKTGKGIPRYRDDEDSDVFVLGGSEDLVPWLEPPNDPADREGYRRPPAPPTGPRRERFRPRVESDVVWLDRVTDDDGRVWWESRDGGGVRRIFGRSETARVVDPGDSSRVFEWLLEEVRDPRGQIVRLEHKPEDLAGVIPKASEAHRLASGGSSSVAGSYLKRVQYGRRRDVAEPGRDDFHFELVFDYGEHDEQAPTPDEAAVWAVRPDPFSSYRAGFERRTYRRCRRVLVFHRFPEDPQQPGDAASWPTLLVGFTRLEYAENAALSYLERITHHGVGGEAAPDAESSLPPVNLTYSRGGWSDQVRTIDPEALDQLPSAIDGRGYQWVDLEGEGIAGVLTQQAGALHYKRNLGQGRLAPARVLRDQPSGTAIGVEARPGEGQRLLDVTGDGLPDLVSLGGVTPGYHGRQEDGTWSSHRPFRTLPNVDWSDPNLRFIDLDGDGFADVLISEQHVYTWYPAVRGEGYGPPRRAPRALDDERGPTVVFSEAEQTVFIADMSGDGLTDLVRIRNGEVSYWPNLGHGRFGRRVMMDAAPVFTTAEAFDPARLRLADIDGSGTTDLVYVDDHGVHLWPNHSGNAFGTQRSIAIFPDASELSTFDVVDILGRGTSCLVWSSDLPEHARAQLRYVDLHDGQKPHLLTQVDNGLGLQTRLEYGTSTQHYLAARAAGRTWVTRLPFPVQVVDRVEHYDHVTRTRFVATYRYAHGYYDAEEREFRGFGYVEQRDAEHVDEHLGQGLFPDFPVDNGELALPPVVTKTWFHTGARLREAELLRAFEQEWFDPRRHDSNATEEPRLPTLPHDTPWSLSLPERHQAHRALAGAMLRQEVYAEDRTPEDDRPFVVEQQSHRVRALQPTGDALYAAFRVLPGETLSLHYERALTHPRIAHQLTLEVDELGYPRATAEVAYGRTGVVDDEAQRRTWIQASVVDLHHAVGSRESFRHGFPLAERHYELSPAVSRQEQLWSTAELADELQSSTVLAFDELPAGAAPIAGERRLLGHQLHRYWDRQGQSPLPFGEVGDTTDVVLPYATYAQVFTPKMLNQVLEGRADEALLREAGYLSADDLRAAAAPLPRDGWWAWSGFTHHDPGAFYQPVEVVDPHGQSTSIAYDAFALAPVEVIDPVGNTTRSELDYRVLAPRAATDPNGTVASVRFDALGRVIATRIAKGSEGDLTEDTSTTHYELLRWSSDGLPARVVQAQRQVHESDVTAARPNRWLTTWTYASGGGGTALVKAEAEPGPVPVRDEQGRVVVDDNGFASMTEESVDPRYIASGRTVVDNKGNPIKQYEPYFSRTPDYDAEEALDNYGVTAVLHHDPHGRTWRSDLPDGTFARSAWSPWNVEGHDANDTAAPGQRWYDDAIATPAGSERHRAAVKSAAHANTPNRSFVDALGRAVVAVSHYRHDGNEDHFATKTRLDIAGNVIAVEDALERSCMTYAFDMFGRMLRNDCIDAGHRVTFAAAGGEPLLAWGDLGHRLRTAYDPLRRPTQVWLHSAEEDGGERIELTQRLYYGEAHPDVDVHNLRGQLVAQLDQAGLTVSDRFDFKGNPRRGIRRLAATTDGVVDWSATATEPNPVAAVGLVSALLEAEAFEQTAAHDALGRAYSSTLPDATRVERTFNRAGLLEAVSAYLRGATNATPVVHAIDYDEKGRRRRIERSNDGLLVTEYLYDRRTFRLNRLATTRPHAESDKRRLQDLRYHYDAAGNIVRVEDHAQAAIYHDGAVVEAHGDYTYDSLYRLVEASGREHESHQARRDENQVERVVHRANAQAMRNYVERYDYDAIGNLQALHHGTSTTTTSWTRNYHYHPGTNQLDSTTSNQDDPTRPFEHDAHGNMTRMPHLELIEWDHLDQMRHARRAVGQDVYFRYDASGQRIRKVWESGNLRKERIYLGDYEIYRETTISSGVVQQERETVHVGDDQARVCMIETRTIADGSATPSPLPRARFQLDNHLGTSSVEVDQAGSIISYEEFHPYGTSAFRSWASGAEVSAKRYRYTGKERDEETGLYYHGARYYAPWLGRWTAADPAGLVDGPNRYAYVRGSPIMMHDPTGTKMSAERAYQTGVKAHRLYVKVKADYLKHRAEWGNTKPGTAERKSLREQLRKEARWLAYAARIRRVSAEVVGKHLKKHLRFDFSGAEDHIANLLEASWKRGITDKAQVAYIIATADHESFINLKRGKGLTENASKKYSDNTKEQEEVDSQGTKTTVRRIDPASKNRKSTRYRGRGYGHMTHDYNYDTFGKMFNRDLLTHPEQAAEEELSAKILVEMLVNKPARPVKRNNKSVYWKLADFGVKESSSRTELAIGWVEARGMHNVMTKDERADAKLIKRVARDIYVTIGGTFGP